MTTPLTTGPHKMFEGCGSITSYRPHNVLVLVVRVDGDVTGAVSCEITGGKGLMIYQVYNVH